MPSKNWEHRSDGSVNAGGLELSPKAAFRILVLVGSCMLGATFVGWLFSWPLWAITLATLGAGVVPGFLSGVVLAWRQRVPIERSTGPAKGRDHS